VLKVQVIEPGMNIKEGMEFSGPIYYEGDITVVAPPIDDEFGVIAVRHPTLQRTVEVYCWKE